MIGNVKVTGAACDGSETDPTLGASRDAQAAQDAADLEAGRAWRRLAASGRTFYASAHCGDVHLEFGFTQTVIAATLPEAVAAALDG